MNASKICAILLTVGSTSVASAIPAIYQRYIGTGAIEESGAVAATRDGGSIIAGTRRGVAGGPRDIVLVKLDYKGATQWEVQIMTPNQDDAPLSITQTFDGGYALVADVPGAGVGLGLGVLRLNPAGGFMWGQIWFGNPTGIGVHGAKIIEVGSTNNLVIASRSSFGGGPVGQDPCILNLNAGGGLVWAWQYMDARYTNAQFGSFMDIRPFRDTAGNPGFLACGWTQQANTAPREPLFMFVNAATGFNTFSNTYAPGGLDRYFNGMDVFPSGDVAATACDNTPDSMIYSFSPAMVLGPVMTLSRFKAANESIYNVNPPAGVIIGGNDPTALGNGALLRVDLPGGVFTHMSYGGVAADRVDQIAPSPAANGVFAAGTINSFTHGASDFWAFRSNRFLRTGCIEGPVAQPIAPPPLAINPIPFNRTGMQFIPWNVPIVTVTDINTIICLKCPADFNGDGVIDFFDYLDYVDAFSMGSSSADFNEDGVVDFFDYLDFIDSFSLGC